MLEMGLDTFGDVTVNASGQLLPHAQVIRDVIEEAVLADSLGIDFIGLGEHHRADFAISAPETVLAAIAGRTTRIRLGTAVTVLSSDDPIRVFQRFATLDERSGTGLGLPIARGVAEAHGGSVFYDGNSFVLRIPRRHATRRSRESERAGHAQTSRDDNPPHG